MNIYISIPRMGSDDAFKERIYKVIGVLQGQYEGGGFSTIRLALQTKVSKGWTWDCL